MANYIEYLEVLLSYIDNNDTISEEEKERRRGLLLKCWKKNKKEFAMRKDNVARYPDDSRCDYFRLIGMGHEFMMALQGKKDTLEEMMKNDTVEVAEFIKKLDKEVGSKIG